MSQYGPSRFADIVKRIVDSPILFYGQIIAAMVALMVITEGLL